MEGIKDGTKDEERKRKWLRSKRNGTNRILNERN
jgi:hypothetical protein